jgi:putative hemolysin
MLWILLAILLVCSGTVSASETALFALSRQTLMEFKRSAGAVRRRVFRLMQDPRGVLTTILLANTTVNVAIFTVSYFAFRKIEHAPPLVAVLGTVAAPLAVILFGEMLPKAAALSAARRFAPLAGAFVSALQIALGPIQWILSVSLVEPITRLLSPQQRYTGTIGTDELRSLVEHSAREGVITSSENEMLQAVVALAEVSVREVMTPRVDLKYLNIDVAPEEARAFFTETQLRRTPVCGRDLDDLRGILYAQDVFLNRGAPIRTLLRHTHFVPAQANLVQVLQYFRAENVHLAAVVDEYGGTMGLVTLEDIVESVVGDLPEVDSPRPVMPVERIDDNTYRLPGNLSIHWWTGRFGVEEIDRYIDTVGGLVVARLGRVPRVGDSIRIRNLTLTVEKVRRRRIECALLRRDSNGGPSKDDRT